MDIEVVTAATETATDILSVADFAKHIRLSPRLVTSDLWSDILTSAIEDAVAKIDGIGAELNKTLLQRQYKRYLRKFPDKDENGNPKPIQLPYGPVISVDSIVVESGTSSLGPLDANSYISQLGMLVPEIYPVSEWPFIDEGPRAISVTYTAGYAKGKYPSTVIRMAKFLAAHYVENAEATILEKSKTQIDRKTLFAMDDLRAALRISPSYDDYGES